MTMNNQTPSTVDELCELFDKAADNVSGMKTIKFLRQIRGVLINNSVRSPDKIVGSIKVEFGDDVFTDDQITQIAQSYGNLLSQLALEIERNNLPLECILHDLEFKF